MPLLLSSHWCDYPHNNFFPNQHILPFCSGLALPVQLPPTSLGLRPQRLCSAPAKAARSFAIYPYSSADDIPPPRNNTVQTTNSTFTHTHTRPEAVQDTKPWVYRRRQTRERVYYEESRQEFQEKCIAENGDGINMLIQLGWTLSVPRLRRALPMQLQNQILTIVHYLPMISLYIYISSKDKDLLSWETFNTYRRLPTVYSFTTLL